MENFKITIYNIIQWIENIFMMKKEIIFNTKITRTILIIIIIAIIGTIIYRIIRNKKEREWINKDL